MKASTVKADEGSSPRAVHQSFGIDDAFKIQNRKVALARTKFERGQPPSMSNPASSSRKMRTSTPTTSPSGKTMSIRLVSYESPVQEDWALQHKSGRVARATKGPFAVPPPPLVQAPAAMVAPKKYTRKNRSLAHYTTRLQSVVRGFLVRHQTLAKLRACVHIQSRFRAWLCRAKLRLAELQHQLERSQQRREYSLQWVQENKEQELDRFERNTRLAVEKKAGYLQRNLTNTKDEIAQLRAKNKKLRSQNKVLSQANEIQTQRVKQQEETRLEYARQTSFLEAQIPKLEKAQKRNEAAEAMYIKFIAQVSQSLENVQEHLELEQKITADTKDAVLKLMELIQQDCDDDELIHEILEMGMTDSFTNTKMLRDKKEMAVNNQMHSSKEKVMETVSGKVAPKKLDSDMADTTETATSDDGEIVVECLASNSRNGTPESSDQWIKEMVSFEDKSSSSDDSSESSKDVEPTMNREDHPPESQKGRTVDDLASVDNGVFVFEDDGEESTTEAVGKRIVPEDAEEVAHANETEIHTAEDPVGYQESRGNDSEAYNEKNRVGKTLTYESEESGQESGAGWETGDDDDDDDETVEEEILENVETTRNTRKLTFEDELVEEEIIEEEVAEDNEEGVVEEEYVYEVIEESNAGDQDHSDLSSYDESTTDEAHIGDELVIEEEIVEDVKDDGLMEDVSFERTQSPPAKAKTLELTHDHQKSPIVRRVTSPTSTVSDESALTGPMELNSREIAKKEEQPAALSPAGSCQSSADQSEDDGNYGLWCYEDQIKDLLARQRKPKQPSLASIRVRDLLKKFENPQEDAQLQ